MRPDRLLLPCVLVCACADNAGLPPPAAPDAAVEQSAAERSGEVRIPDFQDAGPEPAPDAVVDAVVDAAIDQRPMAYSADCIPVYVATAGCEDAGANYFCRVQGYWQRPQITECDRKTIPWVDQPQQGCHRTSISYPEAGDTCGPGFWCMDTDVVGGPNVRCVNVCDSTMNAPVGMTCHPSPSRAGMGTGRWGWLGKI